ncbi:hypothetical protein EDD29_8635 [Actinocorallia herbida]|uniref:Uncharacterized protein n=1 Tax=Actinocorallia herbida TaxID=58109 RepID=A0A3N1DBI9_9ACTN|nr:hypothetical protein [Actinocorallia herbida]ROO90894.1 hypothetical protein EDD29_8635 [Actinocorallia herbida]
MAENDADALKLLHELDDPEWIEWPRGYDPRKTGRLFADLLARLNVAFESLCVSEQDVQDSSEYGRITIPDKATIAGTRIVVCVSKFGSLALICADNPRAYLGTEEAQQEGVLDATDLATTRAALTGLGYVVIPEELIENEYEGQTLLRTPGQRVSWWDRYFGER